jgi:hypothetical protein
MSGTMKRKPTKRKKPATMLMLVSQLRTMKRQVGELTSRVAMLQDDLRQHQHQGFRVFALIDRLCRVEDACMRAGLTGPAQPAGEPRHRNGEPESGAVRS